MRSIVAVIILTVALVAAACGKKPKPPALVVDAGDAVVAVVDAGAPVVVVARPVDTVPAPMVIGGFNVPQPRGFRRAQKTDVIGSPQIEPWLTRGDIVLIDEAAFPPGTVDVGFVSMLNLPAKLTVEDCAGLATKAAETEKGELVGAAALLETGLGPTCSYQLKLPAGVLRGAVATVDARPLAVTASHAAGDEKTATAWNDVVKGMRRTNP